MSPARFMRRHWHKKPLLIRQAIEDFVAPVNFDELLKLAESEEVESRLIQYKKSRWHLQHGPFTPSMLPSLTTPRWTLLVQGVDLHHEAAHALLRRFDFVPRSRLDDLMVSYATKGGGVGPHCDNYDVFLLQAAGKRRWRLSKPQSKGPQDSPVFRPGLPLKILENFDPEEEYVLEQGDMLYLPPQWAHDGIAEDGGCMTYSIGFRTPDRATIAHEILLRLADMVAQEENPLCYSDTRQEAPPALQNFGRRAARYALSDALTLARLLGETLTEPKSNVLFQMAPAGKIRQRTGQSLVLDRRTRMLYDNRYVFINGESWRANGNDFTLMQLLANQRYVQDTDVSAYASEDALDVLDSWCEAGWIHLM